MTIMRFKLEKWKIQKLLKVLSPSTYVRLKNENKDFAKPF